MSAECPMDLKEMNLHHNYHCRVPNWKSRVEKVTFCLLHPRSQVVAPQVRWNLIDHSHSLTFFKSQQCPMDWKEMDLHHNYHCRVPNWNYRVEQVTFCLLHSRFKVVAPKVKQYSILNSPSLTCFKCLQSVPWTWKRWIYVITSTAKSQKNSNAGKSFFCLLHPRFEVVAPQDR